MRQAGIIAAAGLYALDNNIDRLREDHEKAALLARALGEFPGIDIDPLTVQTNIIIMSVARSGRKPEEILSALKARGILLSAGNYMGLRAVTHLDVSMDDVRKASEIFRSLWD
jgi:threonine aldolase